LKLGMAAAMVVFLFFQADAQQLARGKLCVASRTDDPAWKGQDLSGLGIRIDNRASVPWPQRKSLMFDNVILDKRHLITVIDGRGKPVESIRFRFSEYKSVDLCLAYDGYQGIQLKEWSRHTPWCKCKSLD
jgi:hypothetical protein